MSAFGKLIIDEVRRRGKITFAEFMSWALYHPLYGLYTRGAVRTGREGDFYTSVQVGPLFGRCLAEAFIEMWDLMASERFTLIELGGNDGTLAEDVLSRLAERGRDKTVSYFLVETSAASRERARKRLARFRNIKIVADISMIEHPSGHGGCVFSNEFFDALPVHRVVGWSGGLRELYVVEKNGALREEPGALSDPALDEILKGGGVVLPEGQKAEVCLALGGVLRKIDEVLARGFVLTVDYGEATADLYRETRMNGTLTALRKHQILESPFENMGECDITARVDFGRLARDGAALGWKPLIYVSQGTFLVNAAEKFLKAEFEKTQNAPEMPALAKQAQHLMHPDLLGGKFQVLIHAKNVGAPSLSGGRVNRLGRLGSFEASGSQ